MAKPRIRGPFTGKPSLSQWKGIKHRSQGAKASVANSWRVKPAKPNLKPDDHEVVPLMTSIQELVREDEHG